MRHENGVRLAGDVCSESLTHSSLSTFVLVACLLRCFVGICRQAGVALSNFEERGRQSVSPKGLFTRNTRRLIGSEFWLIVAPRKEETYPGCAPQAVSFSSVAAGHVSAGNDDCESLERDGTTCFSC